MEGAELEVLRGFDLERFGVHVLVVEDLSLGARDELAAHLRGRGYVEVAWIGANRVLVRGEERELLERARSLARTVYSPFVRPPGHPDPAQRGLR